MEKKFEISFLKINFQRLPRTENPISSIKSQNRTQSTHEPVFRVAVQKRKKGWNERRSHKNAYATRITCVLLLLG